MPRVSYDELKAEFKRVLLKRGVSEAKAEACATVFADTTQTGGYSHGVNRFPKFIQQLEAGDIKPEAEPTLVLSLGALEQWDANLGIGNVTAKKMMDHAMGLADKYGIGLVALRNANHWMRGGNYGWQAAERGYVGICWSTSLGVIPPWGGKEGRNGTNPIIFAAPGNPPTMLDMSTSMFSYGMLEVYKLAGKKLPIDGGYDAAGNLSRDPEAVAKANRLLPVGYWKGSGLSILLDMIATVVTGGLSVWEVTDVVKSETKVCQIFIAIALEKLMPAAERDQRIQAIIDHVKTSAPIDPKDPIRIPGHEFPQYLEENKRLGIPVNDAVWEKLKSL